MSFHKIREALEAALNTPIIYTGAIEEPIATCGLGGDVAALKDKLEAAITLLNELLVETVSALDECAEALFWSYNVSEWPGDGNTQQDKALARARAAADKIRPAMREPRP